MKKRMALFCVGILSIPICMAQDIKLKEQVGGEKIIKNQKGPKFDANEPNIIEAKKMAPIQNVKLRSKVVGQKAFYRLDGMLFKHMVYFDEDKIDNLSIFKADEANAKYAVGVGIVEYKLKEDISVELLNLLEVKDFCSKSKSSRTVFMIDDKFVDFAPQDIYIDREYILRTTVIPLSYFNDHLLSDVDLDILNIETKSKDNLMKHVYAEGQIR